jgi:hypothetical protein
VFQNPEEKRTMQGSVAMHALIPQQSSGKKLINQERPRQSLRSSEKMRKARKHLRRPIHKTPQPFH